MYYTCSYMDYVHVLKRNPEDVSIMLVLSLLGQELPKVLRFLERVEKPVPRPPTPTVQRPPAGLEETEQAVVLLQRIIRGRTIQNKVAIIQQSLANVNKNMHMLLTTISKLNLLL